MKRWMEPIFVAGIMVSAPAMPQWVLGVCALILIGLSVWMFLADRRKKL